MASPRLLVVQPDEGDPLGPLGDWLGQTGAVLDVVQPAHEALPGELDGYQGVVCLGGAMGANDDDDHPWLADVRHLLSAADAKRIAVLGVCLGAQLLAVACGGRVVRGSDGPEVGPALVAKRDTAWTDPLFGGLPLMPDVLQFHQDVIERLPANAVVLMSATRYPNQAFRIGGSSYGLQFHIETTTDTVLEWAAKGPDLAATVRSGDLTRERLDELHADMAEVWQPFAERFVRFAAGELEPAEPPRNTLPLV